MISYDTGAGPVNCLAFSPDGSILASSSGKGLLQLWDGGNPRWEHLAPFAALSIAFHPDGGSVSFGTSSMATPRNNNISTYRLDSGKLLSDMPKFEGPVNGLAYMDDGRKLLVACDDTADPRAQVIGLTLWPFPCPQNKRIHLYEHNPILAFDADPKGKRFAWIGPRRKLRTAILAKQDVFDIALPAPGQKLRISESGIIAVACGWEIHVFSADSRSQRYTLKGHKGNVTDLAFGPEGRHLLSSSWDETVKLWDVEEGTEKASFNWKMGRMTCVAVAPDGLRYACGSDNGGILVWDAE